MWDYLLNSEYYDEKMVACIIKQILSVLIYAHGKEILHKDLRLENIMIDDALLDVPCVKINDFGTSVEYKHKDKKVKKSRKMTFWPLYFIAPEILHSVEYTEKSDLWSVGIIMYFMLTGVIPTKGITNKLTFNNIKSKDFGIEKLVQNKVINEEAGDLLSKLLDRDFNARYSPVQAYNHPWIIKYAKNQNEESSITPEIRSKFVDEWNYYQLQWDCMNYFGIYLLNSMHIEKIKENAKQVKEDITELFSYDELFEALHSKLIVIIHII